MKGEYYIEVLSQFGFMHFRYRSIGKYPSHDTALDEVRRQQAGIYTLRTYWGGSLFNEGDFKTDGKGNIFISTTDGTMMINNYFDHARGYVYPRAFISNIYMQNERTYNENILHEYINNHKVASASVASSKEEGDG